jgi:hypothetical protein
MNFFYSREGQLSAEAVEIINNQSRGCETQDPDGCLDNFMFLSEHRKKNNCHSLSAQPWRLKLVLKEDTSIRLSL